MKSDPVGDNDVMVESASDSPGAVAAASASPSFDAVLVRGDKLIQMVKLEGAHINRERFLCLVAHREEDGRDEYCLLGLDRLAEEGNDPDSAELRTVVRVGLVLHLAWDVRVSLDGDGGFSLRQFGSHLLFKPVSVQALWTVIQTLHMITERLTPRPNDVESPGADGTRWPRRDYAVTAPQSCINEWHAMADLLVRRPPSPDRRPSAGAQQGENPEEMIKARLRSIMKAADLDAITSKSIRRQLEEDLGENLEDFKSFIDKEILVILGQMDPASKILDYLFLGSEWNASNLEELRQNGITHVLNVTREIDNFFPAVFVYHNVREYDEEATDLLKYLDRTYRFIKAARERGGKVLVHCKMGISRSATVTISYVMKEYARPLGEALSMVRDRRSIVKPNKSFLKQLEVYEGILGAIRHRHTYFGGGGGGGRIYRSKSESCVAPDGLDEGDEPDGNKENDDGGKSVVVTHRVKKLASMFLDRPNSEPLTSSLSGRPKSWSPNERLAKALLDGDHGGVDVSAFEDEDCRCFGDLAQKCNNHQPEEFGMSSSLGRSGGEFVEAMNCLLLPPSAPPPVNSSLFNPNCPCDMEVELRVPDEPVVVVPSGDDDEAPDDNETEAVVRSISNLPLRIRNSQDESFCQSLRRASKDSYSDDILLDSPAVAAAAAAAAVVVGKGEELSVRTLANLYDFKKNASSGGSSGSGSSRPCSVPTLEDSRLFQKAKRLTADSGVGEEQRKSAPQTSNAQSDC